jgi:DNA-binding transcriptional regulator LsrR (DeoR family)
MPYLSTTPQLPFSEPTTSRDAAIHAQSFSGQQAITIVAWFAMRGDQGGTQRECSEQCGYSRQSVSARCHELEKAGLIAKTSEIRSACRVYRAKEMAS